MPGSELILKESSVEEKRAVESTSGAISNTEKATSTKERGTVTPTAKGATVVSVD